VSGLRADLEKLDGRPYGHYRDLRGRSYGIAEGLDVGFDHVQGDPFASPSRVSVEVAADELALPERAFSSADCRRASADFVQRAVPGGLAGLRRGGGRKGEGSGKSGLLEITALGPEVLERTAVTLRPDGSARLRLLVGLPAAGRRILGRAAATLLTARLPDALVGVFERLDGERLEAALAAVEDQVALRAQLVDRGLVAFLADGSVLPRRTGADSRPLRDAVVLRAPDSLAVELAAPNAGPLRGLGIPEGVTLIVGGGYHGKSTLLATLALGVYDHVPGDGRERCVTRADAQTVRAEDGRSVRGVDLRPFIGELPGGRPTDHFDTDDASGSTSQAAAIVEALEAGARALLIDEDTAATNFMIRDARMRRLVPAPQEPITPYLDRVRPLYEDRGVSSVLVVGGAGDYLDVADTVIQMDSYRPVDVSARAREVAAELPLGTAAPRDAGEWLPAEPRVPDPRSLDATRGRRGERVRSVRTRTIEFGSEEIEVSLLFQLVDSAQCRAIGDSLLALSRGLADGRRSVAELLDRLDGEIEREGLEAVCERTFGDRARPRRFEIAAALNRLRSLKLVSSSSHGGVHA
jgi:predicted ABC-class ATPase